MGDPITSLMDSPWKPWQHDQNFRWRKAIVEQILGSEKRKKYKREREISRINRVIQVCLRRNKNVGRIWFKKMFSHQILDEGLKYL